jgi:hypothetical protein
MSQMHKAIADEKIPVTRSTFETIIQWGTTPVSLGRD